jgi:hypothetical protein
LRMRSAIHGNAPEQLARETTSSGSAGRGHQLQRRERQRARRGQKRAAKPDLDSLSSGIFLVLVCMC